MEPACFHWFPGIRLRCVRSIGTSTAHTKKPVCSITRKGKSKLIQFFKNSRIGLYDTKYDLKESSNLAFESPEVAQSLLKGLVAWRRTNDVSLPPSSPLKYWRLFSHACFSYERLTLCFHFIRSWGGLIGHSLGSGVEDYSVWLSWIRWLSISSEFRLVFDHWRRSRFSEKNQSLNTIISLIWPE